MPSVELPVGTSGRAEFISDPTPGRVTRIDFDVPEQIVVEQAWSIIRRGSRIATDEAHNRGRNSENAQNVRYWDTGVWTPTPLQEAYSTLQQTVDTRQFSYSRGSVITQLATVAVDVTLIAEWNIQFLAGTDYSPNVLTQNDFRQFRVVGASSSYAQSLPIPAGDQPFSSFTGGTMDAGMLSYAQSPSVAIDRWEQTQNAVAADQAIYWRFFIPGKTGDAPDYPCCLRFGQFYLTTKGDGFAELWEHCRDKNNVLQWRLRTSFRFTRPDQVCNYNHSILIFPHIGGTGEKHIIFSGNFPETGQGGSAGLRGVAGSGPGIQDYTYTVDPTTRGGDVDMAGPGHVTSPGIIAMDGRRDYRPRWVFQNVHWASKGRLVDQPGSVPVAANGSPAQNLTLRLNTREAEGGASNITATITDSISGATVDGDATNNPQVTFLFNCPDHLFPPLLYAYTIDRDAVVANNAPGQFSCAGTAYEVQSSGADIRHEAGQATINDPTGSYERLEVRGTMRSRIVTQFTPPNGDPPQDVVLIDGYTERPQHTVVGVESDDDRQYPTSYWKRYDVPFTGMFQRLIENSLLAFKSFGNYVLDPLVTVNPVPWKVTDVVKDVLNQLGFLPREIAIQDNGIRVPRGIDIDLTDYHLQNNAAPGEYILNLLNNCIGADLIWDANHAAEGGAWKLLYPPNYDAPTPPPPLINFVFGPDAPGKIPTLPQSYPIDPTGKTATTFIKYASLGGYPIPPSHNHVWMICPIDINGTSKLLHKHIYNGASYKVPGWRVTPNPDSPHYIGRQIVRECPDASLRCYDTNGTTDLDQTRAFMTMVGLRISNRICYGRSFRYFHAPLVFIKDADTNRYRPPRYLDPCSYPNKDGSQGGGWQIRTVVPTWKIDGIQFAMYEIERPEPLDNRYVIEAATMN